MSDLPDSTQQETPFRVYAAGLLVTAAFYLTAPVIPGIEAFVRRYFCSHPIEIVSTVLFFCGMAILLHRLLKMRRERRAADLVEQAARNDDCRSADGMKRWCETLPERLRSGPMVERIQAALKYTDRSSADGFEAHLRYLAEMAAERLHQSYALVRTITWAIPILGFLGTVHGITIAIANLTPEQLDTSLPEVVGGLEAAFDTTALALAMSIVLVFTAFRTERSEQNLLNAVEQFGIDHILPRVTESEHRLPAGIPDAEHWQQQCQELQSAWSETLQTHFAALSQHLQHDVDASLDTHRQAVSAAQNALGNVVEDAAHACAETIAAGIDRLSERMEHWEQALLVSAASAAEQTESLHALGRTLLQMAESEDRLVRLQDQLTRNLEAIQAADAMEQAVSSLSAAVSLLAARTSGGRSAA